MRSLLFYIVFVSAWLWTRKLTYWMLQNSYEEMLLDFMKKIFYLFYYSMWVFLRDLCGGIAVFDTHSLVLNMILLWFSQHFSETDGDKFVIWKWWIFSLFIMHIHSSDRSPQHQSQTETFTQNWTLFFYFIILLLLFLVHLRCLTLLIFLRIVKISYCQITLLSFLRHSILSHYFKKKKYNKI